MAFKLGPGADQIAEGYELVQRHLDNQETTNQLLLDIANASGPGVQTLAITEHELGGGIEVDFPVEGGTRWIIPRLATGGTFGVPTAPVLLLPANNRRLGGTIVNKGAHNINLFLAGPNTVAASGGAGIAPVWLKSEGGSWDFRLGSLLWCGSVCATAETAESSVTVAEV